jgi:small subunit ribosomal protein S1
MSNDNIQNNPVLKSVSKPIEEENFAELLEKNINFSKKLRPGQKVKSKVVSISGGLVYIDMGGKSEGVIELSEIIDKDGSALVKEGDEIEAFFQNVQDGMKKLTTKIYGYSLVQLNIIRDAYNSGLPIKGEVKREIKGGFEISIDGVRCFCPFSQIDLKGGREGGIYLGQPFLFKVLEYREERLNIIVSRRAVLEQERQERINRLKETFITGDEVTGKVCSIHNFGVFVELGGIEGLIPISEISWERIENPQDVLYIGQQVIAKIIYIDWDKKRLTLSIRAMQQDPWVAVSDKYLVDARLSAKVVRLSHFGAFVSLEPGVEGLVHVSNMGAGRKINHPKEMVEIGQPVEVYILSVDPANRKISLSMQPKHKTKKIILPEEGELVEGIVERIMPFGVFLKLDNGITGLIPNHEMGTPQSEDHNKIVPIGMKIKAVVIGVDTQKKKIKLSRKEVIKIEEREEVGRYRDAMKKQGKLSNGFGRLGEILKAKMEEKKISN